jgi:hypothetical protein
MDETVQKLFSQIQTYPELCEANIRFLKGELPMTPYHLGPIDEETVPLVKKLVEINRRGFLTVNGQPALRKITFLPKVGGDLGHRYPNGAWYCLEQRPYLEGYLPKIYVDAFRVWMESKPGYVYNIYEFHVCPRNFLDKLFNRPLQFDAPFLEGTTPLSRRYNVTREQLHTSRKQLQDAPFDFYTNIPRDEAWYDFYAYPNLTTFLVPDTVKLVIMGTEYDKGDIEKLMLQFLKAIR